METPHSIIIGAGIGGLTTAALLLKNGHRVTVLEAHIYPGGSAGTFYNRGYRFDAGATIAGGFSAGGPHARLGEVLGLEWPVHAVDPAWVTHLPDKSITQWSQPEQWQAERRAAFPGTEHFWIQQEKLASLAWDLSSRYFPWPPDSLNDLFAITRALRPRTLAAAPFIFRNVSSIVPKNVPADFYTFLDSQLLISAQTTSKRANLLYGSAALDLPRRGVNHVRTGMGGLAQALAGWIRTNGGTIHYRQSVNKILMRGRRAAAVRTSKGLEIKCDFLIANLTPWNLADLLGSAAPSELRREAKHRAPTWGAFTLYLGLEDKYLPQNVPDHHQVVVDPGKPLGEGNSIFLSLSPRTDPTRAPDGMRAATISTHTTAAIWWELANKDPQAYGARRADYIERVLNAAERALPGIRGAIKVCLPGTPVTFQFYTGRQMGMVGGFPQTSLFHARGPATGIENLWLVGDSVFPGQSTAGTTLGGWRVAEAVLRAGHK
jgi:C-3',4' desaturase CrtD